MCASVVGCGGGQWLLPLLLQPLAAPRLGAGHPFLCLMSAVEQAVAATPSPPPAALLQSGGSTDQGQVLVQDHVPKVKVGAGCWVLGRSFR